MTRCWKAGEGLSSTTVCLPGLSSPALLIRIFGFVAKSQTESQENVCHLFAEYDTLQPASQVISLVGALLQGPEGCRRSFLCAFPDIPKGACSGSSSALSKKPLTTLMDQSTGLEESGTRLKPMELTMTFTATFVQTLPSRGSVSSALKEQDFPGGPVVKSYANAGDRVQPLVREDFTCRGETKSMLCTYPGYAL